MKRLVLTTLVSALCAVSSLAMPTQAELKKAQPLVAELMAPAMADFKAAGVKDKAAAAVKVADKSVEFANSAETEAAKFLLLKGAVNFYTRGESYDKAADMVAALQANVKDVTPAVIVEITGKATGKISETKAPRLFAQYRAAKLQVRAASEAKTLAQKLKKVKSDALQRRYAEVLAVSGDWKAAYAEYVKLSDAKLKAVVEAEAKGQPKNAESGEFWWTYEPAMEDADDFFKSHAAAFYRKALEAGEITGLKKNIVEQRIKDVCVPTVVVVNDVNSDRSKVESKTSTVTTSSGSGKAWQEKGNTAWLTLPNGEQITFVKCPKGKFNMLYHYTGEAGLFPTKMDHDFWISDRVITQAHKAGVFPEKNIAVDDKARKDRIGEKDDEIEAMTDRLQADFGDDLPKNCVVRLPSIAEFEYAYHANAKNNKDPYFSCSPDRDVRKRITSLGRDAGANEPNAWGIHDMICYQRFLDRVEPDHWTFCEMPQGDKTALIVEFKGSRDKNCAPFFWSDKEDSYVMSIWHDNFKDRNVAIRGRSYHFHLVVGPDLVSEWKAKHGKK